MRTLQLIAGLSFAVTSACTGVDETPTAGPISEVSEWGTVLAIRQPFALDQSAPVVIGGVMSPDCATDPPPPGGRNEARMLLGLGDDSVLGVRWYVFPEGREVRWPLASARNDDVGISGSVAEVAPFALVPGRSYRVRGEITTTLPAASYSIEFGYRPAAGKLAFANLAIYPPCSQPTDPCVDAPSPNDCAYERMCPTGAACATLDLHFLEQDDPVYDERVTACQGDVCLLQSRVMKDASFFLVDGVSLDTLEQRLAEFTDSGKAFLTADGNCAASASACRPAPGADIHKLWLVIVDPAAYPGLLYVLAELENLEGLIFGTYFHEQPLPTELVDKAEVDPAFDTE